MDYGGYFASINRNKRSIVLDLKDPADKEVLFSCQNKRMRLLKTCAPA